MRGKIVVILLTVFFALTSSITATASSRINARAAIMVDATSGQVIYQQNARQVLPVASLSKLLTVLVIMDEIDQGQFNGDTKIKITPEEAQIADDTTYSNVAFQAGQSYSVRELVNAALVKSADGAAIVLATSTGRGIDEFNILMQQKASQIGIKDATIVNPVGLTNSELKSFALPNVANNAENKMSAVDVAKLARYVVQKQPRLLAITKQKQANFLISKDNVQVVQNTNKMVTTKRYQVPGVKVDGLKTGTSDTAGHCLACTGTYRGHRIITVVLHATGKGSDSAFVQTKQMLIMLKEEHLQKVKVPSASLTVKVAHGAPQKVALTSRTVTIWTKNDAADYDLGIQSSKLTAPVKAGQHAGNVRITGPGIQTIDNEPLVFPLYTRTAVARSHWLW